MSVMAPPEVGVVREPPVPFEVPVDELDAAELLRRAMTHFGRGITLSCSFGGAGGMVLLDLMTRVAGELGLGPPDVFVLDTGMLFEETYRMIEACEARYGVVVRRVRPLRTVAEQAEDLGEMLWRRDANACCRLRKVEPMGRAVAGYGAWVTAIRRDQASTRAGARALSWDRQFGLWKLCPLVGWDEARVGHYVFEHDLPRNPLLGAGYESIGCVPCTRRSVDGGRSGRWLGTGKVECGLHVVPATLTVGGDGDKI